MVNVDISFLFKVFTSTHFLCSILCVCAHVRSTHTYMHACMCVYVWVYVCVQHLCMSVCFSKGISFSSDIKGCHTCILTSPENVIAMHSDFTRKHFYAFWLHQQTLLCILTSPADTAMHSDFTSRHCYAFWHHQKTLLLLKCYAMFWLHQKTLLCILTSSHTGPICQLTPPTRPLLCTAISLKQRLLQWMSLLHKSH